MAETIENARHKSYKFFPVKKPVTLIFETDNRISQIVGYVESNEPNIFSQEEGTQISILCPNPYFMSVSDEETVFSGTESIFEFPMESEVTTNFLYMPWFETRDEPYEIRNHLGIIYYLNPDKSIRAVGTATGTSTCQFASTAGTVRLQKDGAYMSVPRETLLTGYGNYLLSGTPAEGGDSDTPKYRIRVGRATFSGNPSQYNRVYFNDYGDGAIINDTRYPLNLFIEIRPAAGPIDITFYPMLTLEGDTNTEYRPYDAGIEFSNFADSDQKSFDYYGSEEVGFIATIVFSGEASGFALHDVNKNESMYLDDSSIAAITQDSSGFKYGDVLMISTVRGDKYIRLYRDAITYNILNSLTPNSTWLTLFPGSNTYAFSVTSGAEYINATIQNKVLWEGI